MRTNLVLTILPWVFVATGAWYFGPKANATPGGSEAVKTTQNVLGRCVSSVPKSWGQYRGSSEHYGLTFEAADGTLRFVTNVPCDNATPFIALEIKRTAPQSDQ